MKRKPPETPARLELAGVVAKFLKDYEHQPAPTLAFYKDHIGRAFTNGMAKLGVTDLLEITPDVLREYLSAEAMGTYNRGAGERVVSQTTVHLRQKAAGTFLNWCVNQEFIKTSPMRRVKSIPRPEPDRTAFTDNEVRRMLAEAKRGNWWLGARDYAMLMMLVDTGCRAAGLLNMRMEGSFDWQRGRVKLHEKGDKYRWMKLGAATIKALKAYLELRPNDSGYDNLWLNAKKKPLVYWSLEWRVRSLAGYCDPPIENASCHRFRHYYAVAFYQKYHDIEALRINLGHSRVETTQKYLRSLGVEYSLNQNHGTPGDWL